MLFKYLVFISAYCWFLKFLFKIFYTLVSNNDDDNEIGIIEYQITDAITEIERTSTGLQKIKERDHMFNELKNTVRVSILPFVKWVPLSPNSLTIIGLLVSFWAALAFSTGDLIGGGLLIVFSGFFDMIDGAVARAKGSMTTFGAVLDSVCDRYADAIIFAGIIYGTVMENIVQATFLSVPTWLWMLFAIMGSYLVSYVRSRAEAAGVDSMNVGIAERSERMMILVAGSLTGYLVESIVIIVVLTHITMVQRLVHAKRSLA